jgi:hypothetical protein
MVLHRPIEFTRVTGQLVSVEIHLPINSVNVHLQYIAWWGQKITWCALLPDACF